MDRRGGRPSSSAKLLSGVRSLAACCPPIDAAAEIPPREGGAAPATYPASGAVARRVDTGPFELTTENARAYLVAEGRLPAGEACAVRRLGGGVSNEVLLVEAGDRRWVLKQALPRLRVAAEWLADAGRSDVEARCLELLGRLLPAGTVPDPIFSDSARHILAMAAAPPDARNLKEMLLGGGVAPALLQQAGSRLGNLQADTRGRADVQAAFGDVEPFRQLRLDPYYEEVARRHPRLAPAVRAQAALALDRRACLTHGDYSPKNMLVDGPRLVLLDFEVAHWGCRAFDPAFFLNHLLLKALHLPGHASRLQAAAAAFWAAYADAAGWTDPDALEREVLGHLGCLLLARVDGKSPVEYIRDEPTKTAVRRLAADVLNGRLTALAHAIAAAGRAP